MTSTQIKDEVARLRSEGSFLYDEAVRAEGVLGTYYKGFPGGKQAYDQFDDDAKRTGKFLRDLEPIFAIAEEKEESRESLGAEAHRERERLDDILLKQQSAIAGWTMTTAPAASPVIRIDTNSTSPQEATGEPSHLLLYRFAFGTFVTQVPADLRPGQEAETSVTFIPATVFGELPTGSLSIIPHNVSNLHNLIFEPSKFSLDGGKPAAFQMDEPSLGDMRNPMEWRWTTYAADDFSGTNFEIPFEVIWTPKDGPATSAWSRVGIEIHAPPSLPLIGFRELFVDVRVGLVGWAILRLAEWLWRLFRKFRRGRTKQSGLTIRAAAG